MPPTVPTVPTAPTAQSAPAQSAPIPPAAGAPSEPGPKSAPHLEAGGAERERAEPDAGTDRSESGGGESDAEIAARLRLAVTRLARRLRHQVAGPVTPSQVSALATVERLGSPTLGELAASEQVQPPSMTKMVVGLEAAGLVTRREDDVDRRVVRVELSTEGRRTVQRSRSLRTAYLVRQLRRLSDDERSSLEGVVALLERLVDEP